jgi:SAM-dependent methyltransferase
VFLRGFVNTIRLIRGENVNEKRYGIKTSSIKKSKSTRFFHYQGAGYIVLFKIFDLIAAQTKHLSFMDIGCGKGRPIFVAESYGYNNLTGIDLDDELIALAKENTKRYALKREGSKIEFINANALEYNYKNEPTVYFLFNPFNEEVLTTVINKIVSGTSSETWIIYMNPRFLSPFKNDNFELVVEIKTKRYLEAMIYKLIAKN